MNFKFKNDIEKISSATEIDDKVSIAEELLINTDIIKSENALCQFDNEDWYCEQNLLKKYLEYKLNEKTSIYHNRDCDVTILSIVMYTLLNSDFDKGNIFKQPESSHKYEIKINKNRFRGDTLTSGLHLLKLYLGSLWKKIHEDDNLKATKKYKGFYELFKRISRIGIPVSEEEKWLTYCFKKSDIIWNAVDEEFKSFWRSYFMFGNYILIPANSYKIGDLRTSFNMSRSNWGEWDTVDTLLIKIYLYFQQEKDDDKGKIECLESIFKQKEQEIALETIEWLNKFKGWEDFVEKNCLQSFIDPKTQIPICMKTGEIIDIKQLTNIKQLTKYNPMPSNYEEFLMFFEQASKRIEKRSKAIYEKISSQN